MTEETTTEQLVEIEGQAACTPSEGWRVVQFGEPLRGGDEYDSGLNRYIRPIESQPQPEPETTTEQLMEIEGQTEPTPATEYTPPEGWRVLKVGERLRAGDMIVRKDGSRYPAERLGGWVGSNQRHIRLIEPEPEAVPVQVREGQWRTRNGLVKDVTAMPTDHEDYAAAYPWWDGVSTWRNDGRWLAGGSTMDLVTYLGPIEQQPETQQNGLVRDVTHLLQESGVLDSAKAEQQIEELRSEVSYVQNLLGTERRRVTQLEELVSSLRTINDAQEKTVRLAGQENTDLQHRLDVVSAEWAEQAATINGLRAHVEAVEADLVQQRLERNRYQNQVLRLTAELDNKTTECRNLRIELDALQQAPQAETVTTAPTSKDDRFEEGWDAGSAWAVETIAEWTEPFRTCGSQALALAVMANLPHIMRTLTGLDSND